MKKFLIALAALLAATESSAFFTDVQSQQLTHKNMLLNGGFENGKKAWTASAGTFATVTSAANIGQGNESVSWDASATGQNLRSDLYTIPAGLYGRSCLAHMLYKGGDTGLKLQVIDGSSAIISTQTLSVSSGFVAVDLSFLCPSSGQLRISIDSTADAAIAYFDNMYLGEDYRVGEVSQAQIVGRLFHAKTASCTWVSTDTSGNLVDFPTVAACPGPTVEYSGNGPHTWSTSDADLPQITVSNLPPGNYLVKAFVPISASSGTLRIALSDGTTNSGETAPQQLNNTVASPQVVSGYFSYTSAGTRTFRLRLSQLVSSQLQLFVATAANAGNGNLVWEVVRFPSSVDVAFSPSNTPASWSGYHDGNCGGSAAWTVSSVAYSDPADDGSCTLTELYNRNFGTVSTFGASKPGITFTPPRVGRYLVKADFSIGSTAAGPPNISARLADGSDNEIATGGPIFATTTNFSHAMSISGILNVSSIASTTVKLQIGASSGAAAFIGIAAAGITNYRTVSWSIVELDAPMSAPYLVNSVRSAYTGVSGVEYFRVAATCTSNPCTVASQSGGLSSVGWTSTGVYTANWTAGTWSSTPICTCRVNGTIDFLCTGSAAADSSTLTNFRTTNTSGTVQNAGFDMVCMGTK